MSKAAMSSMTRSLAMEWGPHGIRVNAVAPGFTLTDLAKPLWKDASLDQWRQANTPLCRKGYSDERMGYPEDMVGVSIFLASKAASFVTGQVIYVDGGTTCGLFWPLGV
jgi:NAD(P)-dependent dehydrogenase (short-subunit alcohol dehydrogenase family)